MSQFSSLSISTLPPLPESWVEKMFHKMLLDYGKKFTDQWGGAESNELIAHWAQQMGSYTGPEIARGLTAMEKRDWPPTLPEFKKMCRPDNDPMVSYYEAVAGVAARAAGEMGKWSHPAVYWAAMPLAFDLGNQTFSQIRGRWEQALSSQMERGEWDPIPRPALALPAPGKAVLSKEGAAKMLHELGAKGIAKKASDTVEHRRWAKNILERVAGGDKTLLLIQIQFAKQAVGALSD